MRNRKDAALEAVNAAAADVGTVNKNVLLATVSITLFFMSYLYSSVHIALPAIGREFNASVIELGWVSTAIMLTASISLIPFGRLADIIGLKKMYILGMILYVITNAIAAFSSSVTMLIVMRALQGLSASMVIGNTIAIVSTVFPMGEKGKALGITASAVYVGLTCSPLISGFLTAHLGWRSIFVIPVPAGILILLLIFWKIKGEWRNAKGESLDLVGTGIFAISVTAVIYGFSKLPTPFGWELIAMGAVAMAGFVIWESRVESPLIKIELFKHNRVFVLSNLSMLINYAATYAVVFLMSLYLQYVKGMNPAAAGLVLAVQPVTQALLCPITGKISDWAEPRILASLGMGIICICLGAYCFLTENTPLGVIVIVQAVLGAGYALFVAPNTNSIMSSVPANVYGVASAIMNTMRNFGQVMSMGITMMVLALMMGNVVVTHSNAVAYVASMRIGFLVFALLCLAGVFASLSRGKVR